MVVYGEYNNTFIITDNAHKILKKDETYQFKYLPDHRYNCRYIIMNEVILLGCDFEYFCLNPNQNFNQFAISLDDNEYTSMYTMLTNTSCVIDALVDENDKEYSLYINIKNTDPGLSIDMGDITLRISNSFLSVHDMGHSIRSNEYTFTPRNGVHFSEFINSSDFDVVYTNHMKTYNCVDIHPSTRSLNIKSEDHSNLKIYLNYKTKTTLLLDIMKIDDENYGIKLYEVKEGEKV